MSEMITANCERFGKKIAFENMGQGLTYLEVERFAIQFASYLQQEMGLEHGMRIAIQMPNLLQYPIALFGAFYAGLTVVNVNPLYTADEMHHQLEDAQIDAIIILENFADKLELVLKRGLSKQPQIIITRVGDLLPFLKSMLIRFVLRYVKRLIPKYNLPKHVFLQDTLAEGGNLAFFPPKVATTDTALLQYTGGTTGLAKGAVLSHANLLANVAQVELWLKDTIPVGTSTSVVALPLYHIFALSANCLSLFNLGCRSLLITNPKDMKSFLGTLSKYDFHITSGVNTLFKNMMSHPLFDKINFSHLKLVIGGGMAVEQKVAEEWEARTGSDMVEGYGLSETSPALTINPIGKRRVGSIGVPLPGTDLRLLSEEGEEVPKGEMGEICARGPQVMKNYWQREEETKNAFVRGFFRTGDLATMDEDGYFYIVDRKKDMINISGFKVYPSQVEEALSAHPEVLEVGVRGLSEKNGDGEAVHAFIVPKSSTLTAEELIAFSREKLAAYKVPKYIHFKDSLPKSNVGKILKRHMKV